MAVALNELNPNQLIFDFSGINTLPTNQAHSDGNIPFDASSNHPLALLEAGYLDSILSSVAVNIETQILAPNFTGFSGSGIASIASQFSASPEMTVAQSGLDSLTGLSAGASLVSFAAGNSQHYQGSLRADWFSFNPNSQISIYSGNGNIDFGGGYGDILDLSNLSVDLVTGWDPATQNGGGMIANTRNGTRVFDAMTLSNGNLILMEGLDGIAFKEGFYDFNQGALPNDPYFGSQWNLHMMGVHNAWRFTQGSADILVGVQDTGLGMTSWGNLHADIDAQRTYGMSENINDDFEDFAPSHGTSVQGIIAAKSNNGFGLSGINWKSDVVNLDVLGGSFSDYELDEATRMMADYAASTGRRVVVNMSLGAHGWGEGTMPALEQLVAQNQDNALFVIAAGNDDDSMLSYPAILANSYSNVMAIGASWGTQDSYGNATNPGERISYPGWWGSNQGQGISLMGPSEVVSTLAEFDLWSWDVAFDYQSGFNGTSAAAPNVAGVASLVWSVNPDLSASQVHSILAQTAYDLGAAGYDTTYGHGFVNADAAVRQAMALASVSAASPQASGTRLSLNGLSPQSGNASFVHAFTSLAEISAMAQAEALEATLPDIETDFSSLVASVQQSFPVQASWAKPAELSANETPSDLVMPQAEATLPTTADDITSWSSQSSSQSVVEPIQDALFSTDALLQWHGTQFLETLFSGAA